MTPALEVLRLADVLDGEGHRAGHVADRDVGHEAVVIALDRLDAIEAEFGVPKTLLLAFWGRESSFGEERLSNAAIPALATGQDASPESGAD